MDSISDIASNTNQDLGQISSKLQDKELNSDSFIKLLLTQLKMQNPTNPFDSNTMMQQISQLTSLSSAKELRQSVQELQHSFGTSQAIQAAQLVGKKVQVPTEQAQLTSNGLHGSVVVPQGIENITLTVRDKNDKVLTTIPVSTYNAGVVDYSWDGKDTAGNLQANGFYKVSATAMVKGEDVEIPTAAEFNVNSVAFDRANNGVIINVDGLGGVPMKDILKIT